MIKPETIEKIMDAVRIEDVVGEFVTLKRRGANLVVVLFTMKRHLRLLYLRPKEYSNALVVARPETVSIFL